MKVLQSGMYSLVTGLVGRKHNSFYTSISGRFYYGYAPQDTPFPYCVYHVITSAYDFMFQEEFEDVVVQFNICSKSPSSSETGDILPCLYTLFDWASLSVSGYTCISTERIFSTTDWFDEEGVWETIVQYRILLQKD